MTVVFLSTVKVASVARTHLQMRFISVRYAVAMILFFKTTVGAVASAKPASKKSAAVHHLGVVVISSRELQYETKRKYQRIRLVIFEFAWYEWRLFEYNMI